MAAPLDKSVICPILIGRASSLEPLNYLIEQALCGGGPPRVVLIAGEAGAGKSRLVAEAKSRAAPQGYLILQGNCFESDRALPYAPLLDLLRMFFAAHASPAEISQFLGSTVPELVKLLPELALLLPDLASTPALEPEQEKRRLLQAVIQFFTHLSATQPLLIIIEDLQWSDDTSLEFLLTLARRLAAQPALLLLTYRSDDAPAHPALSHFLAGLDRERLATELTLTRLEIGEVEAMLRAIFELERPVRIEFLEAIYDLTEGNPFFIEEVLKSLITAGDIFYAEGQWDRKPMHELRIPRSVQDAVQRRVTQLSQAARYTLTLAAVAGRRFDFTLLQQLTQLNEPGLLLHLRELMAAQLVVEESTERFAFRHNLTRQAIYTGLLARERMALHRTIAETMEQLYADSPDPHLANLAYHFYEAGAWAKALEYTQRAGEKAQSLYAPRAAIEHLTHALEAVHRLPQMTPRPDLYRARGLAYETMGEFEPARADHEAALQLARAAGDSPAEWRALLDLGKLWASRDYARTGDYFQQALDIAREMTDPSSLARNLNRVGNWYLNVEQPLEALRHHQEALTIFQESQDRRGLAATLDLLGMTSYLNSDLLQTGAYYEQAVTLFRELDDRQGLASSLGTLTTCGVSYSNTMIVPAGINLAEAMDQGEQSLQIAQEIGWRSEEAHALLHLADCLGPYGEYRRALEAVQAGLHIAEEIEHRQWLTYAHWVFGALYLDLLALTSARHHLEQALALAQASGSGYWIHVVTPHLTLACILQNENAGAEAILNSVLKPDLPAQTLGQRMVWWGGAEFALASGDPSLALQITNQLF
ncbi:MAG TPA: AAA family ATPase, partial [Anaerolineae bacterium]|nr:AAA family ATPase [Anaerolineae bacterium]